MYRAAGVCLLAGRDERADICFRRMDWRLPSSLLVGKDPDLGA